MLKKTTISLLALFTLTACSTGYKKNVAVDRVAPAAVRQFSDTVYFDYNSAEVEGQERKVLEQQACALNERKQGATIEGHCDERGPREYNLALGERRAQAVKSYLESQGVGGLRTTSYGKEKPVDGGHNEEAWSKNRRAVTVPGGAR